MKFHPSVISHPQQWPEPSDEARAEEELRRWNRLFGHNTDNLGLRFNYFERLLLMIFGNSPYLSSCVFSEPEFVKTLVGRDFEESYEGVLRETRLLTGLARPNEAFLSSLSRSLRILRRKQSLLVGIAELIGMWDTRTAATAQTKFAEVVLEVCTKSLLTLASAEEGLPLGDKSDIAQGSGLIILGLGKLGGGELNFSSDIDLIVLYDPNGGKSGSNERLSAIFSRLTQRLVELLETRTSEGYVFRTDLRLRPDPLSMPLAVSTDAAEVYYESVGQNWERAAFIKARPVAGDVVAGESFLRKLEPFIWRKTLDFAALADIHSIKSQIDSNFSADDSIRGHNLKLGRGGIREIEFFVQSLQLIWGGRMREVRRHSTDDALCALSEEGLITESICEKMTNAYWFLRRAENRLQMVDDRQTHVFPHSESSFNRFSVFMGYENPNDFVALTSEVLNFVSTNYKELFKTQVCMDSSAGIQGNLVFTGIEDDPETLITLEGLGFSRASHLSYVVRKWHRGELKATRNVRAREILTRIMPSLLLALAQTSDPDTAFIKFDEFLRNLPAGIQLFSLFQASPKLLRVVAEIMGAAPRLSGYLAQRGYLLDALIEEEVSAPVFEKEQLLGSLEEKIEFAIDFQDFLNITRRWSGDIKFLTSVRQLRGALDCLDAGQILSNVADLLIEATLTAVRREFEKTYGVLRGGELCVLGFGKLGGEILTRGSDLDLVFVYRADNESLSNGDRRVSPSTYYSRLCQRLITALSAQTGLGQLYEIDIRLRPMGSSGPLVADFLRLEHYYKKEAWVWELMALTKARVVAGPKALTRRIEVLIGNVLCQASTLQNLQFDILAMRQKVWRERPPAGFWDIKYSLGGLFDLDFLVQYLQLLNGGQESSVLDSNTFRFFGKLSKSGRLDRCILTELSGALEFFLQIQSLSRICLTGVLDEDSAPSGLREVLVRNCRAVDFNALKDKLRVHQVSTRGHFVRLIGDYTAV
ncbi:MAG: bifunctional [glutamate--ammonia ligase]-adenylyl-L-tyrosine phosphorylase/[glutamate--ammonia-ligase] adenylyltransferase [Rhodospirillaceae bacterium]|nr:bifunctional [glutamate--ammonia ligase]-adenylyl-L-tyrosine phosphorylase/[glutamate--ammonia-ligase] adenylyltransferase [Rhodospirillaceae bacterium]